jgi:O-antigen/teichoic acid export membrane protein
MSFPIFLIISSLSKEIMTLYGPEFIAAWPCLVILAFAQLVNAGVGSCAFMLVMTGNQDFVLYGTMGVCFLNILLNYLLVPLYGIVGASFASGISVISLNVFWLLSVYYCLKIHPYNMKFIGITVLAIAAFGALIVLKVAFTYFGGMQIVLASVPFFVFTYAWLIYKWGIDDEDRVIVNFVKGKFLRTMA